MTGIGSGLDAVGDGQWTLIKPLKAVLFDLDETLFDHATACRQGLEAVRRRHRALAHMTHEDVQLEFDRLLAELHPHVLAGALTLDEARVERFRRLLKSCGAETTIAEAGEAARAYRVVYLEARQAVAGAADLLTRLRHTAKIGVVTNNMTMEQEDKLRCCRLDGLVDALVTSEAMGCAKPDVAIFQEALRRLECDACEAIMVGDSWQVDVLGARAAGIRPVWFNRFGLDCPDPGLAGEIHAFEPADRVAAILLGETETASGSLPEPSRR